MKKKTKKTSKKKKSTDSLKIYKYIIYFLVLIIVSLSSFIIADILVKKNVNKALKQQQVTIAILKRKIEKLQKEVNKKPKIIVKKVAPTVSSEAKDYQEAIKTLPKQQEISLNYPKTVISEHKKPKLVIIIDDVAFKYEVKMIKNIPLHITPSFFPPTKNHPYTPYYANEFSHYMVHLPLQALHFAHPEPDTLDVNATYAQIKKRIDDIKAWFPRAKFINNHTGSKFTANYHAMLLLFKALKADHFGFVDSMTTPYTKSLLVDKIYKIPLYRRNIFLDNIENPSYIRNQLQKAINYAKRHGYAIAIGHPHPITLKTLKNSLNMLKGVQVVYIDELGKS
jgi:polysaccharide deacetylase 2 family uncharacterized protein YibQ